MSLIVGLRSSRRRDKEREEKSNQTRN